MKLGSASLAGRERDHCEPTPLNSTEPTLPLQAIEKLRRQSVGKKAASLIYRKGGLYSHSGQESSLHPAERLFSYISPIVNHLDSLISMYEI
jgi:hypothetical protein